MISEFDLPVGVETPIDVEALSVADKCSLSDLCIAATTPYISHRCTPLYFVLHWCNTPVPLTLLQPVSLALSWDFCIVALSAVPSASVSTRLSQSYYSSMGLS